MLTPLFHRNLFLLFSALVAFSLPLSEVGVSVGMIGLVVNWIVESRFRLFPKLSRVELPLLLFLVIYALGIVGLIFTSDFSWAFHDLRIKLPLLLLPIVFFFSERLSEKEFRLILLALVLGVFIGSVASMLALFGVIPVEISSSRSISLFISHIRFSLLVCMAICGLIYLLIKDFSLLSISMRVGGIALAGWLFVFIFILQSITGMVILSVLTLVFLVWKILSIPNSMYRLWCFSFLGAALLIGASFITGTIASYYKVEIVDPNIENYTTANGRLYTNDFTSTASENGHYVDLLVCEEELAREWNRRGKVRYDELSTNGFHVKYALKRYLTSKGIPKDSVGVWSLCENEVTAISKGVANVLELSPFNIKGKIYRLVREMNVYMQDGNVGGSSLAQRFVYWKLAKEIFFENWLIGVGTGDIKLAYKQKYAENPSLLAPQFQLRAHNQYITMFTTYGLFGGFLFIAALIVPIILLRSWKEPLILAFSIIILLSMLNEDTFENHIGVSFAAFFYSVLIFSWKRTVPEIKS